MTLVSNECVNISSVHSQVFHRDNHAYKAMKPLPRNKKVAKQALQGGTSQDESTSVGTMGTSSTAMAGKIPSQGTQWMDNAT